MGCLFSKKKETPQEPAKKEYSWDKKRQQIKVEDFTLDGLQDRTLVRLPGSIDGQQFIIRNCTNCQIFLLDHSATITVEKCVDCQLIIGPIKGSLFLRNCKNCKCLSACQQFRTRDCSKIDMFLCCTTQPIIESSYKMRFGCYQLYYKGLEQQFKDTGLQVMDNTWDKIYDFTPNPDANNWSLIPEDVKISDLFRLSISGSEGGDISSDLEQDLNKSILPEDMILDSDSAKSIVPMTTGERGKRSDESCLVLVFHHEQRNEAAMGIVRSLQEQDPIVLVKTKQATLPADKVTEMFDKVTQKDIIKAAEVGPVIGLEFNGEGCTEKCSEASKSVSSGVIVYVSPTSNRALKDIDHFYAASDMQMT